MYSVELHDGDWTLDQKHDESLGAKTGLPGHFGVNLTLDINACRSVEFRYCDVQTVHICCVYLPVQFIINHRRFIFIVSVIILPQYWPV